MNSIKTWLNGSRTWAVGVALYNTYGDNPQLKEMFAQGDSAFRRPKLEQALRELMHDAAPVIIPAIEKEPEQEVLLPKPKTEWSRVPPEQDPYYQEWKPLYVEMNALRHKLDGMQTDDERGKAAHRICDLRDAVHDFWDKRDYYLRTGQHMPQVDEPAIKAITDINKLEHALRNARTKVSLYKDKPAKLQLFEKWQQVVKDLEQQLPRTVKKQKA